MNTPVKKSRGRIFFTYIHRRTSWGCRLQPSDSGNAIILGQKLNFSGRAEASSKKRKMYSLNEKKEFILSSEKKCSKSGIFSWMR